MKINVKDLNPQDLNRLKERLLGACRDYEPWADMMMLGGAGDFGAYDFPLDLDQIETISIDVEGGAVPQERSTS